MDFENEDELKEPVRKYLEDNGFKVLDEIQVEGKFPDLIGIQGRHIKRVVELKLRKYREALTQAWIHKMSAEKVYVAMPESAMYLIEDYTMKDGETNQFDHFGVGVLSVSANGGVEKKIEAETNERGDYKLGDTCYRRDPETNEIEEIKPFSD